MVSGIARILTLSSLIWLCNTAALGTIALFLDRECTEASGTNTSVKVSPNECLVTSGALGVAIQVLPQCDSGRKASFYAFDDSACASSSSSPYDFSFCVQNGATGVVAIGAVCAGDPDGFIASTTVTVSASSPTAKIPATATGGSAASTTPAGAVPTQTPSTSDNANLSHGLHLPKAAWIGIGIGGGAIALFVVGLILYRLIFPKTPANQQSHDQEMNPPPATEENSWFPPRTRPRSPPIYSRTPASQQSYGQEMSPLPTTKEASWFPLRDPPRCRRCSMPGHRRVVHPGSLLGNDNRPYYVCDKCKDDPTAPADALGRKGWITWDDSKGLPRSNLANHPRCRCRFLARQDRWRGGNGFWTCCKGRCGYFSWRSDGKDGAKGHFEPWLL